MELKQLFEEIDSASFEISKAISVKMIAGISSSLSHGHLYLLFFIRNQQGCIVSDIAKHLNITLSGVTNLTNKLFDMGLVERKRSENDRRLVYIVLTEDGKKVMEQMDENRFKIFKEIFSDIPKEEMEVFLNITNKIVANSKKLCKKSGGAK